ALDANVAQFLRYGVQPQPGNFCTRATGQLPFDRDAFGAPTVADDAVHAEAGVIQCADQACRREPDRRGGEHNCQLVAWQVDPLEPGVRVRSVWLAVEPRCSPPRSAPRRVARLLCVVLLVASAAGCAKLVYNRLDTLAAWYVGNLVSLDQRQSSDLRTW